MFEEIEEKEAEDERHYAAQETATRRKNILKGMKIFSEGKEAGPESQGADQVDAAEGKHLSSRVEQVCIDNKLSRGRLTIKRTADLARRAHKRRTAPSIVMERENAIKNPPKKKGRDEE